MKSSRGWWNSAVKQICLLDKAEMLYVVSPQTWWQCYLRLSNMKRGLYRRSPPNSNKNFHLYCWSTLDRHPQWASAKAFYYIWLLQVMCLSLCWQTVRGCFGRGGWVGGGLEVLSVPTRGRQVLKSTWVSWLITADFAFVRNYSIMSNSTNYCVILWYYSCKTS